MSFLDHVSVQTHKDIISKVLDLNIVKGVGAVILSLYGTIFSDHKVLIAVYLLIVMDTILGFMAACKNKDLSSSAFFRVLIKSIVYFMMILTGRLVDQVVPIAFASSIIESFLVMTEALSILENSSKLGVPIPIKLVKMLKQMGDHKSNTPSDSSSKKD